MKPVNSTVVASISKSEIMAAKHIASRTTFNKHIKQSGIAMPDFWHKQRVFVGWQIYILEEIFNIRLINRSL